MFGMVLMTLRIYPYKIMFVCYIYEYIFFGKGSIIKKGNAYYVNWCF